MGFLPAPFDTPIFGMDPNWVYGILFSALFILIIIRFSLPVIQTKAKNKKIQQEQKHTKTEDKVTKVSMDRVKTKEDHPMGDKTHD